MSSGLGEKADRPGRAGPTRRRGWPSVSILNPAVVIVSVCVAVIVVGGVYLALNQGPGVGPATRTIRARVSGPARAAHARATLQLRGSRASLVVSRLPLPAADHVDQLWVQRGSAPPVPAGTFVVQSGSVDVARPIHRGDYVLVTVEHGRGSSTPTTTPLIVAKV